MQDDEDDALASVPLPDLFPAAEMEPAQQNHAAAQPLTAMHEVAQHLRERVGGRSGVLTAHAAEQLGMDRKALQRRLDAIAEEAVRQPPKMLENLVQYLQQMQGHTLQPLAFVERQAYDSTPAHLRVPDQDHGHEQRRVKLHMIETEYGILFKNLGGAESADQYCWLRVPFHGALRLAERGTAENNVNVLQSAMGQLRNLGQVFGNKLWRLAESDHDGANMRGELLLQHFREEAWTDGTLHATCVAHKLHSAAQKTWDESIITGAIHTYKVLQDSQSLRLFKRVLHLEIAKNLTVHYVASLHGLRSDIAESFRQECLRLFLPRKEFPLRRSLILHVLSLLNGDIREKDTLVHYCVPGCCRGRQTTVRKLQRFLPRALCSMRPHCFARNNWLAWSEQLDFLAWSWALHGVGVHALQRSFAGTVPDEPRPDDAEGRLDGGEIAGQELPVADVHLEHMPAGPEHLQNDPVALIRFQKAQSLRISIAFLSSDWWQSFWIMRVALHGQMLTMAKVCSSVSEEAEVKRMHELLDTGRHRTSVVALATGELTSPMLDAAMGALHSDASWRHLQSTEAVRSAVWQKVWRPAAAAWQLITHTHLQYPWRIFLLLVNREEQFAASLLNERPCLRDPFAHHFFSVYNTSSLLVGEECYQLLSGFSALLNMCTFTTECHHSGNQRRAKMRSQVKRMDVSQLALRHASCTVLPWLKRHMMQAPKKTSGRKRGRPPHVRANEGRAVDLNGRAQRLEGGAQEHAAADDARVDRRRRRKRRGSGGGGAARAFLHIHGRCGKWTRDSLSHLWAEYRRLSPEQRLYYIRLGEAGLQQKKGR